MKLRIVIVIILSALPVAGYLLPREPANPNSPAVEQQNRRRSTGRTSRGTATAGQRRSGRDYSVFSHRSDKHKSLACDACHQAPSANWKSASKFPDISDYPSHASCVRCHRTEFFKGSRPPICSICHTKVSPRDEGRFPFGKPREPSQFNTIFPHDKHQDVIARAAQDETRKAHFTRTPQQKTTVSTNDNCTICHESEPAERPLAVSFPDAFRPPIGTFKTTPTGHESCFNCHWKNQEPTHNQCAGCHELSAQNIVRPLAPNRISLKFTHQREQHYDKECTSCHIRITQVSTLRGLKPDVPISSCSECHKQRTDEVITVYKELTLRDSDASYVCKDCHTSEVGKRKVPASHRALFKE